jgi:hypothetical protein
MGGPGSGNRWRYGAKSTTDDYRTLDVRRWAREGVLKPGYRGGWQWTCDGETVASIQMRAEQDRVILRYRHRSGDAEWKDEQYAVRIVRTPCNLGGRRAWFNCPAVGCGRRVAILSADIGFAKELRAIHVAVSERPRREQDEPEGFKRSDTPDDRGWPLKQIAGQARLPRKHSPDSAICANGRGYRHHENPNSPLSAIGVGPTVRYAAFPKRPGVTLPPPATSESIKSAHACIISRRSCRYSARL